MRFDNQKASFLFGQILRELFDDETMKHISGDHHKTRDGGFEMGYNYFTGIWWMGHPGYVRGDIEVDDTSFIRCAEKFLSEVHMANQKLKDPKLRGHHDT